MAVLGRVDGMQGTYAVGWAVADPDTKNCSITVTSADGTVVAKGRASQHRPDLAALQLGRTSMAFRLALPGCGERKLLHVLADGVELPGSPLEVGPGRYDGDCIVERGAVTGWVCERTPALTEPLITIVNQDGAIVGQSQSKREEDGDRLFSKAHFAVELYDMCFGAGELQLSVLANGVKFAERSCNFTLQGNLETITQQSCAGWLISPDVPQRCFEFEIFRDGLLAGTAKCNIRREDVRDVFPGCTTAGFGAAFPLTVHNAVEASAISLRFRGSDRDLFDGPFVVANRAAAVAAAQRAARIAHAGLAGLGAAEKSVIQLALSQFLGASRGGDGFVATRQAAEAAVSISGNRLTVVIPIYRDVEITRNCIESVLAHRTAATDRLLLVNDASPDPGMAALLSHYATQPNIIVLTNGANLGFVKTVNRALNFAGLGDVLLLNSDTVMFAGSLDELHRVAHSSADIGTATAISNNATVFSYPNPNLQRDHLPDCSWAQLAKTALQVNAGLAIDVPTAHGFCVLIKAEVLRRVGSFDERFGRGYGEENDFCSRAADLGYRNVAAAGVLVQHTESTSFAGEKSELLTRNLLQLNKMYPEYTPIIMEFERQDGLRRARWGLDEARLKAVNQSGVKFALVISNSLDGGTNKAIRDIEQSVGYGTARKLSLVCRGDEFLELSAREPLLHATFAFSEIDQLFKLLSAASPVHVLVHQLLGFPSAFIKQLGPWAQGMNTIYYSHDFYSLCPRVTLIDATDSFCNVADSDVCGRCVDVGGAHEASKLDDLAPAVHRALFADLLRGFRHVVAPSPSTANYLRRIFPGLAVQAIAHPESSLPAAGVNPAKSRLAAATAARIADNDEEIILLGAIGPHKGSSKLLEIAQRAKLTHPKLRFRVIGYTNNDQQLLDAGNVTITGHYTPDRLPTLITETRGRLALFLHGWPETYSYTLSEAVSYGFIPLVPDIGAPAERVRAMQFGVVFPFPIEAVQVLNLIDDVIAKRVEPYAPGANPQNFHPGIKAIEMTRKILNLEFEVTEPAKYSPKQSPQLSDKATQRNRPKAPARANT